MRLDEMTRRAILSVAIDIQAGRMDQIIGSRKIVRLMHDLETGTFATELFTPFIAFESDTEDVPRGPERGQWSAEGLKKKDAEVAIYLRELSGEIEQACHRLIDELSRIH